MDSVIYTKLSAKTNSPAAHSLIDIAPANQPEMLVHGISPRTMALLHASLGMASEAGEMADMLKRHTFYGTRVDRINALEEVGDCLWYQALAIRELNSSFADVMAANIAKLQFRYGDQFDSVAAVVRDCDTERQILEKLLPMR